MDKVGLNCGSLMENTDLEISVQVGTMQCKAQEQGEDKYALDCFPDCGADTTVLSAALLFSQFLCTAMTVNYL